jgi:hypothetical protein
VLGGVFDSSPDTMTNIGKCLPSSLNPKSPQRCDFFLFFFSNLSRCFFFIIIFQFVPLLQFNVTIASHFVRRESCSVAQTHWYAREEMVSNHLASHLHKRFKVHFINRDLAHADPEVLLRLQRFRNRRDWVLGHHPHREVAALLQRPVDDIRSCAQQKGEESAESDR